MEQNLINDDLIRQLCAVHDEALSKQKQLNEPEPQQNNGVAESDEQAKSQTTWFTSVGMCSGLSPASPTNNCTTQIHHQRKLGRKFLFLQKVSLFCRSEDSVSNRHKRSQRQLWQERFRRREQNHHLSRPGVFRLKRLRQQFAQHFQCGKQKSPSHFRRVIY